MDRCDIQCPKCGEHEFKAVPNRERKDRIDGCVCSSCNYFISTPQLIEKIESEKGVLAVSK